MHILLTIPNGAKLIVHIDSIREAVSTYYRENECSRVYLIGCANEGQVVKETVMEIWNAIQHERSK